MSTYIIIDNSDAYHTSVMHVDSKEKMLDAVQFKDIDQIEVYEVSRKVRLAKRPAIIEGDD